MSSPEELYNQYQHIAKETLFRMFPDIKGICRKHRIEFDDLLQYARTGLWKGCLSYQPNKSKFITHAINNIRWHVVERLRRETSMIKYNCNQDYDTSEIYGIVSMDVEINDSDNNHYTYHDVVADETIGTLENAIGDIEGDYILSRLTDKQRKVVELKIKGLNSNEIGRLLNMTGANARAHFNMSKNRLVKYQLEVN
jgi:RNA polymerase sigma factor (sigma-70 family)